MAAAVGAATAPAAAQTRPAPQDTVRARRDAVRAAPSDSSRRDSVIAGQLTRESRTGAPVYHRYAPDRLRLTALGVSGGVAFPDQVEATPLYAVHADYGELGPHLRVVFGVSYWTSHVTAGRVAQLARAVRDAAGTAPTDSVRVGPVQVSDVAVHMELRWRPVALRRRLPLGLRPWVGGGGGVHLLDFQGAPLTGTFVERALDGVAFGVAVAAGVDATLLPNVQLSGQGRYDLFSGAHYPSLRLGAVYILDRRGRP